MLGGGVSNIDLCYCGASKPVCLSSYVSIFFYYFLTNIYHCVDVDLLIFAASLSREALVGCTGVSGVSWFFFRRASSFFFRKKKILNTNTKIKMMNLMPCACVDATLWIHQHHGSLNPDT